MTGPGRFARASAASSADKRLRANLLRATLIARDKRLKALSRMADSGAIFQAAESARADALENLHELLIMLEERVIAAGGQVHWARDAAEANLIIARIAESEGAKLAVKGKSMVTEETGLNSALAEAGVEAVEADLGEYIVQLAGEPPSHILAPAIHKNRDEIAGLFAEKLGAERTSDPEKLTLIARSALREKFLAADMGITGANFCVAETGTVVLVENEGNIRMCATLPRVHVAVTGIEKVVRGMDGAAAVLNALARSATGQTLSSYTSFITGPRRDGETDGPEKFHLVLLDNGRSRIRNRPEYRDFLRCIRCGSCLYACPVYERSGGHAYGSAYCGPMGALMQSLTAESPGELPYACTGCGACAEICPVGVDHAGMLMRLRAEEVESGGGASILGRGAAARFSTLARLPLAWRAAFAAVRRLDRNLVLARRMPGYGRIFSNWSKKRRLPKPASRPFSRRWPELKAELERIESNRGETP
jgi:L-lactate dehydrogenase complex protein LldF